MSDASHPPAPPEDPRDHRRIDIFFGLFERLYRRWHHPDANRRHRHYAHAYAISIAFGVPLMGCLIDDFYIKLVIACLWFALIPNQYFWLEGMEIDSQIKRFGLLDQDESDYQRKAMYLPYFGVIFAFVVWLMVLIGYILFSWPRAGWWGDILYILTAARTTPMYYGFVEWGLLAHTLRVAYQCIDVYYPLISRFLQATAGQRRVDEVESVR